MPYFYTDVNDTDIFDRDSTYSSTGTFITNLGTLGNGKNNIGSPSKDTEIFGHVSRPNLSHLIAIRTSSNVAIPANTDTVYVWNSVLSQFGNISLNTPTGVVTITKTGQYLVNANASFSSTSAGANFGMGLSISGQSGISSNAWNSQSAVAANRNVSLSFSEIIFATAGTTLSVIVRCNVAASGLIIQNTGNVSSSRLSITSI